MIYKFLAIADIHWGAMDSQLTYDNLQYILEFISSMKDEIDFVVICGDYFDYRIQLNSKTALLAVRWMEELLSVCREANVKKVRILKGTQEHDNDQLEIFRPTYEDGSGFFKIFNKTTVEDLFENLRVVYAPDETLNLVDYERTYWDRYIPNADLMFFHGNLDSVLPSIEYNRIQSHHLPNMIYEYNKFSRLVKGPLIGGHWHIGQDSDDAYYVGSYDRWKFGEEEPKGFIYGAYNTETSEYYIHRVENPYARIYKTLIIEDNDCQTPNDFAKLIERLRQMTHEDPEMKLRVVYIISKADDDIKALVNVFQQQFSSSKQVKVDIKDLVKKEEKVSKKKAVEIESSKYEYIFNTNTADIPAIIRQFILDKKGEDISVGQIEKYVKKYLPEMA